MPICEADPWRLQYFEDVPCPAHVRVPTEDADAFAWNPHQNWVYDKFATDVVHSSSGWSIFGVAAGVTGGTALGAGGSGSGSAGAASTSQRTLTVIVKFDENHRVRDFAYRTSRF